MNWATSQPVGPVAGEQAEPDHRRGRAEFVTTDRLAVGFVQMEQQAAQKRSFASNRQVSFIKGRLYQDV